MPFTTNFSLPITTYKLDYNFVTSRKGGGDRVAIITLYGPKNERIAELHFYQDRQGVTVVERPDHVDVLLSAQHLDSIHCTLRVEKPLYITFFRDPGNAVHSVWFGTSEHEPVGEEEGLGA